MSAKKPLEELKEKTRTVLLHDFKKFNNDFGDRADQNLGKKKKGSEKEMRLLDQRRKKKVKLGLLVFSLDFLHC